METQEFVKLTKCLIEIIEVDDKFQRIRMESILGFPQVIIDDVNDRHHFPTCGYNRIPNSTQKWLDIKTTNNTQNNSPSLIQKLYHFSSNERTVCEVFLIILEASLKIPCLLKYIRYIPKEEPGNGNEE